MLKLWVLIFEVKSLELSADWNNGCDCKEFFFNIFYDLLISSKYLRNFSFFILICLCLWYIYIYIYIYIYSCNLYKYYNLGVGCGLMCWAEIDYCINSWMNMIKWTFMVIVWTHTHTHTHTREMLFHGRNLILCDVNAPHQWSVMY